MPVCRRTSVVIDSRDAPIIGIGRLSAVLPIIGIGRLLRQYRPIIVYTVGKYKKRYEGSRLRRV